MSQHTWPLEKADAIAARLYRQLLKREPDPIAYSGWAAAMARGELSVMDTVIRISQSDEFYNTNFRPFIVKDAINNSYKTIVGHDIPANELESWHNTFRANGTNVFVFSIANGLADPFWETYGNQS